MAFEDYKTKPSVVLVYTGEGKGKTSASVGLLGRALGNGWRVAFIQFIKHWDVSEHTFIREIQPLYGKKLFFFKGGKGFYNAGDLSAKNITPEEHRLAAELTFETAMDCATSGNYELVICDEINNAVNDGLLNVQDIKQLITQRNPATSLCLTGRNFKSELLDLVDIATEMKKIKHHFDDNFLANKGIDF
ncbi:cob(I)yrinic acid a,c-diamide adenosyltransferase [Patescibacteria group bacterium]|nr:cob(I)yrinic acid a,c-diamide adenosyltransferase [Patescibacteria group bacterium]